MTLSTQLADEKIMKPYHDLVLEGVEKYNEKDYESALKTFLEMAQVNYENPKVHEILSYIYLSLGDSDKSNEEYLIYRELIRKENPFIEEPKTFDELVEEAGDEKGLEKEYKKLMRKRKNKNPIYDLEIPAKLSVLYMSKGEFEKAEEVLLNFKKKYIKDKDIPDWIKSD